MGIFVVILIGVIWLAIISNAAQRQAEANKKEIIRDIKKICPPHKWFYQEIKDHEGVTHAWKLVCEHCGPLRPIDGRANREID